MFRWRPYEHPLGACLGTGWDLVTPVARQEYGVHRFAVGQVRLARTRYAASVRIVDGVWVGVWYAGNRNFPTPRAARVAVWRAAMDAMVKCAAWRLGDKP